MQAIISDLVSLAANTGLTPTERLCALETLESLVRLSLVNDKRVFHTIKHLRQLIGMALPIQAGIYFMKWLTGPDAGKISVTYSLDCNTSIPSQLCGIDHTVLLGLIATSFDPSTSQNDIIDALRGWMTWCASVLNSYLATPYQQSVGMFWMTISDMEMQRFIEYAEQQVDEQGVNAVVYNHLMSTADIRVAALPERFVSTNVVEWTAPTFHNASATSDYRIADKQTETGFGTLFNNGPIVVDADPTDEDPVPAAIRKPWNIFK